jgi:DNA primase
VRCADPDHPDELRIDLDPQPGTGFAEARAVAFGLLRPLLDELGKAGCVTTVTGAGDHVVVEGAAELSQEGAHPVRPIPR